MEPIPLESLSARRAWIEIARSCPKMSAGAVALRKESVDRNNSAAAGLTLARKSLSARRAWIEISATAPKAPCIAVALRKESVDRNKLYFSYSTS